MTDPEPGPPLTPTLVSRLMRELQSGQGTPTARLPGLAAGILGIVPQPGPAPAEAAELARTTPYSVQAWAAALSVIDGHPHRDALLEAILQLGGNPHESAVYLVALSYQAPRPRWLAMWRRRVLRRLRALARR